MSKVSITRSKLDNLATSISIKSGATLPLTLDQMIAAVDNMGSSSTLTTANGTYNATDDSAE